MSLRSSIEHYRTLRQAPIWKLLASDNGPQAIAILQTLLYDNERVLPASVFFDRLRNAYAEGLQETLSRDEARTLALRWVSDGYLVCRLPAGAEEETFELTSAGADAIRLLSRFDSKRLGPTESRLEMLTHALARLATESDPNQQNRIELLEAEKMRIDQEIESIRAGRKQAIAPEAALQRIAEILELYAELQGDFRRVREEFERLNRALRAEIMQSEDTRGAVLDRFFEGYDVIGESAAGQAFTAFYRLLTDNTAHGELEDSLALIASRAFYRKLALADRRKLTGLQEELLARANETHAVMRLLAMSLKEFVRSQDFVKERHLAELIRETRKLAHEVSKEAGVNDTVWEWDLTSSEIDSVARLELEDPKETRMEADFGAGERPNVDALELMERIWQADIDYPMLIRAAETALTDAPSASVGEVFRHLEKRQGLGSVIGLLSLAVRYGHAGTPGWEAAQTESLRLTSDAADQDYAVVTLPDALEETLEWEDRRGTPRRGSVPLYYFDAESLKKIRRSRRWG